jgi:hypothetical protein
VNARTTWMAKRVARCPSGFCIGRVRKLGGRLSRNRCRAA